MIQARQLVITVCTHFAAVELYCGYSIGDFGMFAVQLHLQVASYLSELQEGELYEAEC